MTARPQLHMRRVLLCIIAMSKVARSMRIAIQGSGMAAASCAQRLSKAHEVTVFESGRGPGGRMSTRRAGAYQWDHGAQYFSPKTEQFARAVEEWRANGWCDVWDGDHCVWSAEAGVSPDPKASGVKRYVGTPGMNAICKGLLAGIDARFETLTLTLTLTDPNPNPNPNPNPDPNPDPNANPNPNPDAKPNPNPHPLSVDPNINPHPLSVVGASVGTTAE